MIENEYAEQSCIQEEILRIERREAVGRFARGFADDFNNILTAIWGNVALAKRLLDPAGCAYQRLHQAELASSRAKEIIQRLLLFTPGQEPAKEKYDIALQFREAAALALQGSNIDCRVFPFRGQALVDADRLKMRQVLHSLMFFARGALPEGGIVDAGIGRLRVGPDHPLFREASYLVLTFHIREAVISEAERGRLLEPFLAAHGSNHPGDAGIGLAVSYDTVRRHGGLLTMHSRSAGILFRIYLPGAEVSEAQACP